MRTFIVILTVFCLIGVVAASETAKEWNDKGRALCERGKYEEAIECFDKAIEINPDFVCAWHGKGRVLYEQGKYEEAIKCYDKAIEIDPNLAYVWHGKALALDKLGRHEEAHVLIKLRT